MELGGGSEAILDASRAAPWTDPFSEEDRQAHIAHAVSQSNLSDLERKRAIEGFV